MQASKYCLVLALQLLDIRTCSVCFGGRTFLPRNSILLVQCRKLLYTGIFFSQRRASADNCCISLPQSGGISLIGSRLKHKEVEVGDDISLRTAKASMGEMNQRRKATKLLIPDPFNPKLGTLRRRRSPLGASDVPGMIVHANVDKSLIVSRMGLDRISAEIERTSGKVRRTIPAEREAFICFVSRLVACIAGE